MGKKVAVALLPLILLLLLPALLRETPPVPENGDEAENLVILTPHAESIKSEFERAFARHYRERHHKNIRIDWRSPGGTSDIVRHINDRYEAAFRHLYETRGGQWNNGVAEAFRNPKVRPDLAGDESARARAMFLNSNVSIGADLFFGGGTYDHANQARKGYAVDAGIERLHPDWFQPDIIPQSWSGEAIYDPAGGYYGICLATFGICYNPDRMKLLGKPPRSWNDLGEARFFNQLVVADPTKSGSINKCFEVIIQQCMAEDVARDPVHGVAEGWRDGLNLIKRMVANSRAVTESAGKVTREVASGNAAAGMAIDFYALSEAQYADFQTGGKADRIVYVPPPGGSLVSADPVQLLRGAPNPGAAREFIEFLLSEEGQKLWEYRPGTPGGPEKYALRRPPVRRDLYTAKHRPFLADREYNPYQATGNFIYRGNWTGPYFNLIRVLIRTTMLDAADELKAAWNAIVTAGGPEAVPEAMTEFNREIVPYAEAKIMAGRLYPSQEHPMEDVIALRRAWTRRAIAQYRQAEALAREGR